jgi:hypothetical protein
MAVDITRGKRPPHPTDPSHNQWLQDPVWDTITTCWSDKPEQRYELSVVYSVFVKYSRQETRDVTLVHLNTHHNRYLTTAETPRIEVGQQQRGGFLPRIASLFQFLRESELEIERDVGEMDKVGSSTFPLLPSQS